MKQSFVVWGSLLLAGGIVLRAESPLVVAPRAEQKADGTVLRIAFEVPANHVLYADKLHLGVENAGMAASFELPEPVVIHDKFSGKEKKVFAKSFEASFTLTPPIKADINLNIHFQGCNETECFFPEDRTYKISSAGMVTRVDGVSEKPAQAASTKWRTLAAGFSVAGRGSGYLNEKDFLGFLDKAQSGLALNNGITVRSGFMGILLTIVIIVLGGVALNLTPCILPMIPINLAIIGAGAQAGSKRRGFMLGATYAAGMAVSYGVLGLVVVLTGAKFGTLNSSPWFNLGIAAVFIVLALGMFDILTIDLSRFQGGVGNPTFAAGSKFILAYVMGSVAALLAGACVAPVVISVLLQATALHAKGVTIGLLLPLFLGVGMGLPWPFAGAGLSFLPKPGKWMVRVKYGFGVMIILFAFYYGHLAVGLFRSGPTSLASGSGVSRQTGASKDFTDELAAALEAARADGKPVFVDFWASWCKNCSAMEHTTFSAATVRERLAGYHEVRFQAEKPNQPPAKEVLDHFNVMGLPSYLVLKPDANLSKDVVSVPESSK